ncbi:MAG: hypothetical protein ACKOT0_01630 [bacterium]
MRAWTVIRVALGVILACAGTAAMALAVPAALASFGIVEVVGRSGIVAQPVGEMASAASDTAIVVDGVSARLQAGDLPPALAEGLAQAGLAPTELLDVVGDFVLVVVPGTDEAIFVGTGDAAEIDEYLFGFPYTVVERGATEWSGVSVPGEGTPPAPTTAGLWRASADGSPAELPGADLAGSTLVVMNADGSPGISADLRLEYRAPEARPIVEGATVTAIAGSLGGLLLILGGAALIVGRGRPARSGRHA